MKAFLFSASHCAAILMAFENYQFLTAFEQDIVHDIDRKFPHFRKSGRYSVFGKIRA